MGRLIDLPALKTLTVPAAGEVAAGFARGTRLLTPNGYVPVEAFKPGDPIITRLGIRRAVRRIGRCDVEIGLQMNRDGRPVMLLPGAMGPGLPSRAVRLSPAHPVFIDGVGVPVLHLVNGAMILREDRPGPVTYFDVELDRQDVLITEGLPVAGATLPPRVAGPKLARIRRRLHDMTLQAGFSLNRDPGLRGILNGAILEPEMRPEGALWLARFDLPADTARILLLARHAAPAETDPQSDDWRELSICLRQPRAKRQRLALGQGWHAWAPGDPGIWMSGSGEIMLPPNTAELTLHLTALAQSWMRAARG